MMDVTRVVVIGASAGGVEPLKTLAAGFRGGLSAAYFVVLHTNPSGRSFLPEILTAAGPLPAVPAADGAALTRGMIYVAAPDCHLAIEDGKLRSFRGPKENRHRPSVNTLFRSAARVYGANSIGVILSGSLDDGTVGLWEIKKAGGTAIVQSPEEATFPSMPRSAIENVRVDYVVPVTEIPSIVNSLVADSANTHKSTHKEKTHVDRPTDLTCPECRGPLHEIRLGSVAQVECRVGHCYSPESALEAHEDTEERTLWSAVVALEEGAEFALRLVDTHAPMAAALRTAAEEKRAHARAIRHMITDGRNRVAIGTV